VHHTQYCNLEVIRGSRSSDYLIYKATLPKHSLLLIIWSILYRIIQ